MHKRIYFDKFDRDGDGELDDREIVEMFLQSDAAAEAEGAAEEMMADLDKDESGTISLEEYFKTAKDSSASVSRASNFGPTGVAPQENEEDGVEKESRLQKARAREGRAEPTEEQLEAAERARKARKNHLDDIIAGTPKPKMFHGEPPSKEPKRARGEGQAAVAAAEGSCGAAPPAEGSGGSCGAV
jgi:hypothetical protein